jgi:chromosome segregation ATPase
MRSSRAASYQVERSTLQQQYAATEARWLREVDRARQGATEAAKDHERQLKEFRSALASLQSDRDHLSQALVDARSDLKTAVDVRQQLEERLRMLTVSPTRPSRTAGAQGKRLRTAKRKAK